MKSWIPASRLARIIFVSRSCEALLMQLWQSRSPASRSGRPRRMFSLMEPEKREASWATNEILDR